MNCADLIVAIFCVAAPSTHGGILSSDVLCKFLDNRLTPLCIAEGCPARVAAHSFICSHFAGKSDFERNWSEFSSLPAEAAAGEKLLFAWQIFYVPVRHLRLYYLHQRRRVEHIRNRFTAAILSSLRG